MSRPDMNTADAEGWRPEPGDLIIGVVDDIDVGWSDFRGDYPILTIRAGDGTKSANVAPGQSVKLHCFHDVLYSRIMTLRPEPGETVGVQFHGKEPHKTKPNQTVSRYTFKVSGRTADAAAVYDRMGAGRVARPAPQRQAQPSPATAADFGAGQTAAPTAAPADDDIPF